MGKEDDLQAQINNLLNKNHTPLWKDLPFDLPQEKSALDNANTFLTRYQWIRKFRGFGNTWDTFVHRYRGFTRILDHNPPHPLKNETDKLNSFDQVGLQTIYGVLVAESIIQDICPRLKKESRSDLVGKFTRHIPQWLKANYDPNVTTFEILTQLGQEQSDKDITFETFNFVQTILLSQIHEELKQGSSPTRRAMSAFAMLNEFHYNAFRQEFRANWGWRLNAIKSLFNKMYDYVAKTIMDPSDEHHDDVRAFLEETDSNAPQPYGFSSFFDNRLFGHSPTSEDLQNGRLAPIKTLRKYGSLVGNPWYVGFADALVKKILTTADYRLLLTHQLTDRLQDSPESAINYEALRETIQSSGRAETPIFLDTPDIIHRFFPHVDTCLVYIQHKGPLLGVSVHIVPENESEEDLENENEIHSLMFRYAVDISEENPNVFVQVFDEENITENLKAKLVDLTITALDEKNTHPIFTDKNASPPVSPPPQNTVLISPTKSKGPEKTPGSGKKRKHQQNTQLQPSGEATEEFLNEIVQRQYHKQLDFPASVFIAIQNEHGYTSRQMGLFGKKVHTYNAGGTIAKPLLKYSGPHGLPVIEIKTGIYRILAEVNADKATIYDIVPRRDL